MKETKAYWYHNTAYSVERYFVYFHFPNLISSMGMQWNVKVRNYNQKKELFMYRGLK